MNQSFFRYGVIHLRDVAFRVDLETYNRLMDYIEEGTEKYIIIETIDDDKEYVLMISKIDYIELL